jgi:probable rRNA maturation factor
VATEVVNRQRRVRIDRGRIAHLADQALEAVGRPDAAITVAFVRDAAIRRLNRDYRGKDISTDVLSFPAEQDMPAAAGLAQAGRVEDGPGGYLGDVVISADKAVSQAQESCYSFEREVSELVIHGVLHLCGYDHETDQGEMNRMELKLRRRLLE